MINRKKILLKTYGISEGVKLKHGPKDLRSISTVGPESMGMSVTAKTSKKGKYLKGLAQNKADKILDLQNGYEILEKYYREFINTGALPKVGADKLLLYVKLATKNPYVKSRFF